MSEAKLKTLVSRANYPIIIVYNGEEMVISPRAIIENVNPELIKGVLPNDLQLI